MSSLHVYVSSIQKATRYRVGETIVDKPFWVRNPPNRLLWCHRCCLRRPAKNLRIQVYYDGSYLSCLPGKGCHGMSVAAARRKRRV